MQEIFSTVTVSSPYFFCAVPDMIIQKTRISPSSTVAGVVHLGDVEKFVVERHWKSHWKNQCYFIRVVKWYNYHWKNSGFSARICAGICKITLLSTAFILKT